MTSEKTTTDDYFGGCPTCGKNDGYTNVGKSHWFFCHEHRVQWCTGTNLFSSWHGQTEAEQREAYKRIEDYVEVEPIHPDPRDELKCGVITNRTDSDRWQMEMIDAALDGLDTMQRLLEAKLTNDALKKLGQVRGDIGEVRKHLLGVWDERLAERAGRAAAAGDATPF